MLVDYVRVYRQEGLARDTVVSRPSQDVMSKAPRDGPDGHVANVLGPAAIQRTFA